MHTSYVLVQLKKVIMGGGKYSIGTLVSYEEILIVLSETPVISAGGPLGCSSEEMFCFVDLLLEGIMEFTNARQTHKQLRENCWHHQSSKDIEQVLLASISAISWDGDFVKTFSSF